MKFCALINCIDGRVQVPAIEFLQEYYKVNYVDTITEPGPIMVLSEGSDLLAVNSILKRLQISIEKHQTSAVGIVAHYDCAANPNPKKVQLGQLKAAIEFVQSRFPELTISGLWVDSSRKVELVFAD